MQLTLQSTCVTMTWKYKEPDIVTNLQLHLLVLHLCYSDKDRREWAECFPTAVQIEWLGVGAGQRQAGVQRRETGLHHCTPESFSVSVVIP